MKKSSNVPQTGQIDDKITYGDYTTLGQMLNCNSEAAKKRYKRGNVQAIEAMRTIIETRENMIQNFNKD